MSSGPTWDRGSTAPHQGSPAGNRPAFGIVEARNDCCGAGRRAEVRDAVERTMALSADAPAESAPVAGPVPAPRTGRWRLVATGFVVAVVAAGTVLRFLASGPLWL